MIDNRIRVYYYFTYEALVQLTVRVRFVRRAESTPQYALII